MTKSDLNSELKMAATIMTWFSRGIPFGIGQSRSKWNILNTSIKTWMANLSIGDEDNCCQRSSFDHSVSTEPGSLLCSPPRDFKQYWIWPSLRSERKSSKRVRFESDYTDITVGQWSAVFPVEDFCKLVRLMDTGRIQNLLCVPESESCPLKIRAYFDTIRLA